MAPNETHTNDAPAPPGAPARTPRWVLFGLAVGGAGALAWGIRWLVQGERTVWTDVARRFYAPDATLGWVQTEDAWVWLGLDGLAVALAIVVGVAGLAWLARRVASPRPKFARVLRTLSVLGAGLALAVPVLPVWAFVSGMPPAGAAIVLPEVAAGAATRARPALSVTATRWAVADSAKANLLAVRIEAGKETFDGRFTPITGTVAFDARRPSATTAELAAPAASLETGVEMRDGHARGYLKATEFPTIGVRIHTVTLGAFGNFTAKADVALMGKTLTVDVLGALDQLSDTQRAELGLSAPEALLVTASFTLLISETPLTRENFDSDRLVVTARVALVPTP